MVKFGGSGRSKQACVHRRCPNMAFQVAEEDEGMEVEPEPVEGIKHGKKKARLEKKTKVKVEWIGEPVKEGRKKFFSSAFVNGVEVCGCGCVHVCMTFFSCRYQKEIVSQ